jgi:hypothetical protein
MSSNVENLEAEAPRVPKSRAASKPSPSASPKPEGILNLQDILPLYRPLTEVQASAAERGQRDLFFFCHDILHYRDMLPRVHQQVCDLWAPYDHTKSYEEQDEVKNILLLDPRGEFKTSISLGRMLQEWVNWPEIAVLRMSGVIELVKRSIQEVRDHLLTNSTLRELYPKAVPWSEKKGEQGLAPTDFGTAFGMTHPARQHPRREPSMTISSLDSVKSGSHFEKKVGDDLVHEKNYQTRELLQQTVTDWELSRNLLNPGGYRELDGTRYDWSDLYGKVIETNKGAWKIHVRPIWTDDYEFAKANGFFIPETYVPGDMLYLHPERWTLRELLEIQSDNPYLFNCFPAGAPILMSDFTEKPIEQVRAGEEVVGYEFGGKYGGLKKASVVTVWGETREVVEAATEDGRIIRCTPDHKWLNVVHRATVPYHELRVGRRVVSVYKPRGVGSAREQRLLDYLGGLIDGEGSINGSVSIHQSTEKNPEVCRQIENTIMELGLECEAFTNKAHGRHGEAKHYCLKGGRSLKIWLLNHAMMGKTKRFRDYLWQHSRGIGEKQNGKGSNSHHKILSVKSIGVQKVYNIQTTTGNYVAYGYATKNCQRLNNPVPASSDNFPMVELIKHTVKRDKYPDTGLLNIFMGWKFDLIDAEAEPSVGVVGGWDSRGRLFLIDLVVDRLKPSQIIDRMVEFWQKWPISRMVLADTKRERMLEAGLVSRLRKMGLMFPIDWVKFGGQDQSEDSMISQVLALEPLLRENQLWFHGELPHLTNLYLQFSRFPKFKLRGIPYAVSRLMNYRTQNQGIGNAAVYGSELYSPALSWNRDDESLGAGLVG